MPRPAPDKNSLLQKYLNDCHIISIDDHLKSFNNNTKIVLECINKHTYTTNITKIIRGNNPKICPHCKNNQKNAQKGIPLEIIQKFADLNNLTFNPVKDYYKRWDDHITFFCKFDSYSFIIKSLEHFEKYNADKKIVCPHCTQKNKGLLSEKEFKILIESIHYEQNNNFELLPTYDLNNTTETIKNNLINDPKWNLITYTNTQNKATFQCKTCGTVKQCYPNMLFNNYNCLGCKQINNKKIVYEKIKNILGKSNIYPIQLNNEIFLDSYTPIQLKCNTCGFEFEKTWNNINQESQIYCPECYIKNHRKSQNEVYEWLKTVYQDEIKQEYKELGIELDIFIPDKKIAIEYCGNIWHSTKYNKNNNKHKNKLDICIKNNIRLFTIFEDEWIYKKEICKSRLLNCLHKIPHKLFARKLKINKIDTSTALKFCENNHIQGKGQSSIAYGLFDDDKLVSVMTFSKPSISKNTDEYYDYELNRFCSLLNYNIIGGASKLLKQFIKDIKPSKLLTFCDLRWGIGNVYEKLGFSLVTETKINYYYCGPSTNWQRKHRFNYCKHKILSKYPHMDKNKTEFELTEELNLYQIYDCGHKKFEMIFNNK
jgi:Zn finger protein HypA/HybF involved in hydrogenase expression